MTRRFLFPSFVLRPLSSGAAAALLLGLLAQPAAAADPVADFYRGKQIKLYIRAAPGGNYDIYSRLLGRHIGRFIPGNPSVLPINMPGGGGLVALNYVANVAPRDGTVLTMITQSFPMDQTLGLDRNLKVDLRTLNWIGNMSETNEFFYTAKSSPTRICGSWMCVCRTTDWRSRLSSWPRGNSILLPSSFGKMPTFCAR